MGICDGEIKGNPDIAGTGIVAAVFINAIVTIILSNTLWIYVFFFTSHIRLRASDRHPRWIFVLRDTLVMQGDSQLISGLAIIIASLVNMYKDHETPLYHIFIARSLADICLTGHSASIILVPRTEHNWTFRLGLAFSTIGLWEFWSYAAIKRFRQWSSETPHCLENNNIFAGKYEHWIILSLVWVPLGYLPFYLNTWGPGRDWTDRFEALITAYPRYLIQHRNYIFDSVSIGDFLCRALLSIVEAVVCVIFLAFAVLVPASCTLLPLQSFISLWWDTYDVTVARAANAHIVVADPAYQSGRSFQNNDNPEHDWGFGQILPFVMLLLPILTALDYLESMEFFILFFLKKECQFLSERLTRCSRSLQ